MHSKYLSGLLYAALPALAALGGERSDAQELPQAASASQTTEQIVVTGSRVVRDGYEAPTPTTLVSDEDIANFSPAYLADYLNQLPALANSLSPTTGRNGFNSGANFLSLRGLGVNRTLVLLDGQRVAPSILTGGVDMTLLPTGLVERVEIVTGGASAAWGSDAVAGVVNLVLDKDFSGIRGEVQYGVTDESDGEQYRISISAGTPFADGRGHLLFNLERTDVRSIDKAGSRDWYEGWNIIPNPQAGQAGEPARLLVPGVGVARSSPEGVIFAGPLAGTGFAEDGSPSPYDLGFTPGLLSFGGDAFLHGSESQILVPLEADTVFLRGDYDLSSTINVFAEGSFAQTDNDYLVRSYQRFGDITIQRDNAFIHPELGQAMDDAGITSFEMGKLHLDFGPSSVRNARELFRILLGAEGEFSDRWSWDAYYQRGQTTIEARVTNNVVNSRYNMAIDSVEIDGESVCRSTLTDPENGCVPVNPFGATAASEAARQYVVGVAAQDTTIEQQVLAANLYGEPIDFPAGPVSIATGIEYREESYTADADELSLQNAFFLGNWAPSAGEYDVIEGYFEAVAPLLSDAPFAESLDFNGAVRVTDYEMSGGVTTWKAGLTWQIVDDVRFRGTYSKDIRAPNLNELFQAGSVTNFAITDPELGGTVYSVQRIIAGNEMLQPEDANTTSIGFVFTPGFLPGFSAAIDWFDIDISGAVFTPDGQTVVDRCFNGHEALCSAITRDGSNTVTTLRVVPQNVNQERLKGLDLDATYRIDMGEVSDNLSGRLSIRLMATWLDERTVDSFGSVQDYVNFTGDGEGVPEWRALGSLSYDRDRFGATLTSRYVSGGYINPSWTSEDININEVDSRIYFDLSGKYRVGVNELEMEFFGVVENLLDKDPPIVPPARGNAFTTIGTNAAWFDTVGREYRAGVRLYF